MIYECTRDFIRLNETLGTIKNTSKTHTIEMSQTTLPNSGVLIYPAQELQFKGNELYIRCIDGVERVYVAPFITGNGYIGGSDYELPTASESIKGGVIIGAGLSMTGDTLSAVPNQLTTEYVVLDGLEGSIRDFIIYDGEVEE